MKAVLFDVDGTLVDSNELHVEAWRAAFQRHGKEIPYAEMHAQMGKGGDQLVEHFLGEEEQQRIGAAVQSLHLELFLRDFQPRARAFPGVRRLLERIKADGVRIVLATSAKEQELKGHLQVLGIDDLVDHRTTADDAAHSKPCPDIFQAALDGLDPNDALVVGDSPYDAQAARRAGIPMLGVLTGGFTERELLESGARKVFRDLETLREQWT